MSAQQTYIVVGTGQAGGWAARTLRESGFDGRIVLIGEEAYPPYERPPLSKGLLLGEATIESTYLWPGNPYDALNIELRLNARVTAIAPGKRSVELADGETLSYDKLMLALGARPRLLPVPGADLGNVFTLRAIPDTLAIRAAIAPDAPVVVIGGGWIGLEVAAAARKLGAQVTVVEALDRLCARAATHDLSAYLLALHQRHGVDVRLNAGVVRLEGDGAVGRVVLANGTSLDAAAVVVGIGVVANVELAQAAGLAVDNGIKVDELGRTSDPAIWAAGDVTNHPNKLLGRRIRLESWENAQNQAIAAAKAMLGGTDPYAEIPWFWSDQYDVNLQLVGVPEGWDESVTRGVHGSDSFMMFYLKDGKIVGATGINNPRDVRMTKRIMTAGKTVDSGHLADPEFKLQTLMRG